jgi:hypothetical protein
VVDIFMMPKNTKHALTKGQERPLPMTAIDEIPIAIAIAPNGFLGTRENPNGVCMLRNPLLMKTANLTA